MVADQALINPPYTSESVISVSAALNGSTEDNGRSALLIRVKHVVCHAIDLVNDSCSKSGRGWG